MNYIIDFKQASAAMTGFHSYIRPPLLLPRGAGHIAATTALCCWDTVPIMYGIPVVPVRGSAGAWCAHAGGVTHACRYLFDPGAT